MAARARVQLRSDKPGGSYFTLPKTNIKFIRSGSKILDLALGGGWAMRRVSNIIGDRSTGKTLLAIEAMANFDEQYPKGKIHYRETEEAFDNLYAQALGLNTDHIERGDNPLETIEDLYEDLEKVIGKKVGKEPIFYIVDSLDGLSDRAELDRKIDQGTFGAQKAKLMSQLFRRINGLMARGNITFMIISQTRDKIGVFFGSKHTRSGGKALDFYASQELWLTEMGKVVKTIRGIKRPIGIDIGGRVKKNKVGLAYRDAKFTIRFGFGIDDLLSCMDWLKTVGGQDEVLDNDKLETFMTHMCVCPKTEFDFQINRVHEIVQRKWYEIEQEFMPQRRKYGND